METRVERAWAGAVDNPGARVMMGNMRCLLAMALSVALLGCGGPGPDPFVVRLTPRSAMIAYAKADGSPWDGDLDPVPGLASYFKGDDLPEGATPRQEAAFGGLDTAPDPFVELFLQGRLLYTSLVLYDNLAPYWDGSVEVGVVPEDEVIVKLWDADEGAPCDPIGEARVSGDRLLSDAWEVTLDMGQAREFRLVVEPVEMSLE